jgi:hypothetical protein
MNVAAEIIGTHLPADSLVPSDPTSKRKGPKRFCESGMAKVAVAIVDQNRMLLKCQKCGQVWSPNLRSGGRLPRGYWQCPNGCNHQRPHGSMP